MSKISKKKNVFFVVTGLQVINAVECIYGMNKENDYNILVVCNKENTARTEVNSALNLHKWDKIIYLPPTFILNIRITFLKFILNFIFSWIKINTINFKNADLIGNDITIYYRYATKKKGIGQTIFIDDGNGTVNYKEENPYKDFKNIKNKTLFKLLGISKHIIATDVFFTAYPSFISKKENQKVIKNDFSHIKLLKANKGKSDLVYFIGDPHVERGYLSKEKYLKILINVKNLFGENLIYIPRIFEDEDKLAEISRHIKVQRNYMPFELFVASSDKLPKALVAYHSTALFNTNKMFGNSIEYNYIRLPDFTNEIHMNNVKSFWENLDKFATEIQIDLTKI